MLRTMEGRIPAEVMEGIRSLCKEREESFTDTVLLLMGLVNNVYERGEAVVYRVDFLPGQNGLERRVYASLSLENTDTAESALQKLTKSAAMPKDYGMGNEDGLYGLNVLAAKEADGGVSFVMSAEEERFSDAQLGTVINMLVNFAKQLAEEPDRPLCELERVNPEERLRIIEASRGPDLSFDTEKTWLDLFQENAEAFPDALAVSADNGTYTYGELDTLSDVLALALLEKGAKEGDFVVLKLDRVKEFMTAVVGIHKAGCAYIPVDPAYPEDRINFMIEDSGADIVLTEQDIVEILSSYEGGGVDAKKLPGAKPDGRAYMIYTSGSTGRPKGVMIAHRSLMNFTVSIRHLAGIRRGDRIIAHRSFSFDAHIEDYFPTLAAGAAVFIIGEDKRRDSDEIVAFMNENHLTGGGFTTSVARVLMTQYEMPMRYIIAGGEALYGITGKPSIQIINEYGPTECTDDSTWYALKTGVAYNNVPIGRAMPNSWCFVVDSNEKLLPLGVAGELCVAGAQVGIGYHNREELTKQAFTDCPFVPGVRMYHTGDLVRYNEDGEIEFLGRMDNQVKLRGYRIELGEIEAVCGRYEGIKEAVALVSEIHGSKHLILYYTVREGAVVDESRLRNYVDASTLPNYMKPELYMRLDRMPLLPNAKIDRRHMPLPDDGLTVIGEKPVTALETHLLIAAKEFLPGIDFGVTDDLFTLGMTSLSAMRFVAKVNSLELNVKYRVTDVMRYRTIRKLIAGSRRIFWNFGTYDEGKPMLVFVYGIAPVARTIQLLKLFSEAFNIFVIEATDGHFVTLFQDATYDEVIDMYLAVLENHLPPACRKIDGFMGFSWGGFVSYFLAARWSEISGDKPFVVMGDTDFAGKLSGKAVREITLSEYPENLFELTGGAITQLEVVNKMNMVARLDSTVKEIIQYEGPVIQLHAGKSADEAEKEKKLKNLQVIKEYAKGLSVIEFPNHTHEDLFYDESQFERYLKILKGEDC